MRVKYLQEGGPVEDPAMAGGAPMPEEAGMAPEGGAPAPGGQDQMMAQLDQMAEQLIQQLGPDVAGALAQIVLEKLQGGAPMGGAPEEAPMPAPEEQPAFQRMGGVMRRIY